MSGAAAPVVLVGLGATGVAIGEALIARGEGGRIAAAVDSDPAKAGRELGDLLPGAGSGRVVGALGELGELSGAVAVLTTASRLSDVSPLIEALLERRANVVGLCEELSFPWRTASDAAARIDGLAREAGVSVLGTGANPGFVMDVLPLLASTALLGVSRIEVERTADLSGFGPLLNKFGFGLPVEEFERRLGDEVVGHIGFEQTLDQLCDAFGLERAAVSVSAPRPILITEQPRSGEFVEVPAGTVAAVEQRAEAVGQGLEISLRERFGILRAEDRLRPGDRISVADGDDGVALDVVGLDSKRTTVAVLVNALSAIPAAPAGLHAMADLAPRRVAAPVREAVSVGDR